MEPDEPQRARWPRFTAPAVPFTRPATSQNRAVHMPHCDPRAAASDPAAPGPRPLRGRSCRGCPGGLWEQVATCEGWPEAWRTREPQGLLPSSRSLWAGPRGACSTSVSVSAASVVASGPGPSRQPRWPAAGQAQSWGRHRHSWLRHVPSQLHWQLRLLAWLI